MSQILRNLMEQYSKEGADERAEGEPYDDSFDVVDMELDTAELESCISRTSTQIDQGLAMECSLSTLLDTVINSGNVRGMTQVEADIYRLSVEAALRSSYVDFPIEVVVPSFEAAETMAEKTEAVQKKADGVLSRMLKWLAEAWNSFATMIGDFMRRMMTGANSLEGLAKKMKEKAKDATGTKAEDVKVGPAGRYLIRHDSTVVGKAQVEALVTDFKKFADTWGNGWDGLTSVKVDGGMSIETVNKTLHAALNANAMIQHMYRDGEFQVLPLPNHRLLVDVVPEKNTGFITSQKCKFEMIKDSAPSEVPALKGPEIEPTIDIVIKAIDVYRKADTAVQKLIKDARGFASKCNTISSRLGMAHKAKMMAGEYGEQMNQLKMCTGLTRSMVLGSKIAVFGWQQVMPQYLQYLRANLKHVQASITLQSAK